MPELRVTVPGAGRAEQVAAVRLARALSDALNPESSGAAAMLGRALLHPLCTRVVKILADQGYHLVRVDPDDLAA